MPSNHLSVRRTYYIGYRLIYTFFSERILVNGRIACNQKMTKYKWMLFDMNTANQGCGFSNLDVAKFNESLVDRSYFYDNLVFLVMN